MTRPTIPVFARRVPRSPEHDGSQKAGLDCDGVAHAADQTLSVLLATVSLGTRLVLQTMCMCMLTAWRLLSKLDNHTRSRPNRP